MEYSYFEQALSSASREDRILLLNFLKDPKTEQVRNSVQQNSLIVEGTGWKIAFYSQLDISDAIGYLKESLRSLVPA